MNFNKKTSFVFLSLLMLSVFAVSFASAADNYVPVSGQGITAFLQGAVNLVSPVTSFLFGAGKSTGDSGFIALMAFLLTLLVVAGILSPMQIFGDKAGINWAIAAIVALIGVRFVSIDVLRSFTLGSEGLVGALFLIVPFIVVATLIMKSGPAIRKLLWIVYAVVMLALLLYNWNSSKTGDWTNFYWIYVGIIAVCLIAFSMDGTIQKFFRRGEAAKNYEQVNSREIERIEARISDLETDLAAATTEAQRNRVIALIDTQKRNLKALTR